MMSFEMRALSAGAAKCSSRATVRIDDFPPDLIAAGQTRRSGIRALSHPQPASATAAAEQTKRRRFDGFRRAKKAEQFIKTFAGLSQLRSRWPCGGRAMPLNRLIELSAE